jgi:polysaccharide export outer membrane protein
MEVQPSELVPAPNPYAQALQDAMVRQQLTRVRGGTEGYVIGARDVIEIKVFGYDKMDTVTRVDKYGNISVAPLGELKAEGLTERELEEELERRLRGRYLQSPHVSAFVKEPHASEVAVVGAVENPGRYVLMGQKRLINLLTEAGGLTVKAGRVAYVLRFPQEEDESDGNPGPQYADSMPTTSSVAVSPELATGEFEHIKVDLDALLLRGEAQWNLVLMPGDLVNVPEAGAVHVTGPGIEKPGTYELKHTIRTVRQVIDEAEGLKFEASKKVRVLRTGPDGKKSVITVKYKDTLKDIRNDVILQPGDMVIVRSTPIKGAIALVGKAVKELINVGLYGSYSIPL